MFGRRKWLASILGTLIVGVSCSQLAIAQSSDDMKALRAELQSMKETQALRNEVQAIKDSQVAIQKDLQEIKTLLQQVRAAPAAAGAPAPTRPQDIVLAMDGGGQLKGDNKAKLTLVEFTDYQCPFCSRYARDTYPEIMKEYVNTGKVKYVVREFPLESIHPQAFKASEAALCAGDQRKYFDMHDKLFSDQKALAAADLPKHAETLGLDVGKFQECLTSGKYAKAIRKDMADGQKAGVTGTPSFFIGVEQPNGSFKVLNVLKGAQPYAAFKEALDSSLTQQ
jgi:protein-disulfide isomerase